MKRGERFVQDKLRDKVRRRERWIVGMPAAVLALLGLVLLRRSMPSQLGKQAGERYIYDAMLVDLTP